MKRILIISFSLISINVFCQDDDFEKNIKKMLEIQGVEKNWQMVMTQFLQVQKKANPKIEDAYWNKFEKEIFDKSYTQLVNLMIPIYKKYLTEAEVKASIEFYESDAGKSLIKKTPLILKEAMDVGEKLGRYLGTKIAEEVEQEKSKNFENQHTGCMDLKVGKFKYMLPDSSTMIIERDDKFQFEYSNGNTTKYKIKWIDECKYSLEIVKTDSPIIQNYKGKILVTNIYEATNEYYKFVSGIEGEEFKMNGIIYRIK